MEKRIISNERSVRRDTVAGDWVTVDDIATLEVTSEDSRFPIENALTAGDTSGWRASESGEQQIRVVFERPMHVRHIHLFFRESEMERTQEFVLRWTQAAGGPPIEIVRQRWNFSPSGSTSEIEDYSVDLKMASALYLAITHHVS